MTLVSSPCASAAVYKLKVGEAKHCVKCPFIELYNEELQDLLSMDEGVNLNIYDEAFRRGHDSTLVQDI